MVICFLVSLFSSVSVFAEDLTNIITSGVYSGQKQEIDQKTLDCELIFTEESKNKTLKYNYKISKALAPFYDEDIIIDVENLVVYHNRAYPRPVGSTTWGIQFLSASLKNPNNYVSVSAYDYGDIYNLFRAIHIPESTYLNVKILNPTDTTMMGGTLQISPEEKGKNMNWYSISSAMFNIKDNDWDIYSEENTARIESEELVVFIAEAKSIGNDGKAEMLIIAETLPYSYSRKMTKNDKEYSLQINCK